MENNQQTTTKSGTGNFKRSKKVGLSSKNLGSVMSILTNIYADAYEATLREYWANALDSHRMAGQERPVEVTLPTILSPSLLIQDFGIGLSEDEIFDVYAEYGESTKNDDGDEQVGGFGIGAKSAFTMGSQFIVTGVKDGQKTTVLFSMGEDGVPDADMLGQSETTDPNGVLISLAVEDIDRMRQTAARVFSVSDPALTLVDGVHPDSIFTNAFEVNATTLLVKEHDGRVYALLGPVAYPVSRSQFQQVAKVLGEDPSAEIARVLANWDSDHGTSVFFKAGVNSMHIAPNREALRDTKRTISALAALVSALHRDLTASVQVRLDKCTSVYQAAMEFRRAQDDLAPLKVSRKSVHFEGLQGFKSDVTLTGLKKFSMGTKNYRSTRQVVLEFKDFTFDANTADKVLVVTEVPKGEESTIKRYAKRFLEETEGVDHIVVTDASAATYGGWFTFGVPDGAQCMTRDEYRAALRALRSSSPRTSNEPSYTVGVGETASRDLEDRELLTDILSWDKPLLICHGSAPSGPLAVEALADYTVVVLLATQSEAALVKRVEADGTVEISQEDPRDLIRALAAEKFAAISDDEKAALGAVKWLSENKYKVEAWAKFYHRFNVTAEVDEDGDVVEVDSDEVSTDVTNEITHPAFLEILETRDLVELVAADISPTRRRELEYLSQWVGSTVETTSFDYEVPSFEETFPLVRDIGWYQWGKPNMRDHALAYVNSLA